MLAPRGHLMDTLMLAQNSTASQACEACYKLQVTDPGAMGCLRSRVTSKYFSVFQDHLGSAGEQRHHRCMEGGWSQAAQTDTQQSLLHTPAAT